MEAMLHREARWPMVVICSALGEAGIMILLGAQADHSHQRRTEDDRKFPEHVVETVEFRGLLFGNEP